MNRRELLRTGATVAGLASLPAGIWAQGTADFTLAIAPLELEIAPKKIVKTFAYNGQVPGPLIRWPEGKPVVIDVENKTGTPELVHWHGLWIPSLQDGAMEEGSPMIAPGGRLRYLFTPRPAGLRWYHTHTFAGKDLKKASYTGQFGCFYVEPKADAGAYDQEIFLTLHDWNGYMAGGDDASMDVAYEHATVNGKMLGAGDPLRVRQGQRVMLHLLNASATLTHWIALPGHVFQMMALDGNRVPVQAKVQMLRLGPAERVSTMVEMTSPGVWVLGEVRERFRKAGMGMVVEYAGESGEPKWVAPASGLKWDYAEFAGMASAEEPHERIPMVFKSKFTGHGDFDHWMINGKSYPKTDVVTLKEGKLYRLMMDNQSGDDHPVHLHRHSFELVRVGGRQMTGVMKDVVVVPANEKVEVQFVAGNPGATLFHCHQQEHMDAGFMMLFRYA